MGIASAVIGVLGIAYSAHSSSKQRSDAKKERKKIEEQEADQLEMASAATNLKRKDRQRRLSLYGRQSTLSSFSQSTSKTGSKTLFGG